jgi:hypothetical protein
MTAIVEGFFKQGHIELLQAPRDLPEGRVRVILISQETPKPPPCYLQYGKYAGDNSTLEDFKDAQWHGEAEFDHQYGQ